MTVYLLVLLENNIYDVKTLINVRGRSASLLRLREHSKISTLVHATLKAKKRFSCSSTSTMTVQTMSQLWQTQHISSMSRKTKVRSLLWSTIIEFYFILFLSIIFVLYCPHCIKYFSLPQNKFLKSQAIKKGLSVSKPKIAIAV